MQQLELVPYLLYEKEDNGILWIKFNRPEKLNAAVGGPERNGTLSKVGEYMRAGDDDPDVKVIVLTGVGTRLLRGRRCAAARDLGQFEPTGQLPRQRTVRGRRAGCDIASASTTASPS